MKYVVLLAAALAMASCGGGDPEFEVLATPPQADSVLYFVQEAGGGADLYALDIESEQPVQVTGGEKVRKVWASAGSLAVLAAPDSVNRGDLFVIDTASGEMVSLTDDLDDGWAESVAFGDDGVAFSFGPDVGAGTNAYVYDGQAVTALLDTSPDSEVTGLSWDGDRLLFSVDGVITVWDSAIGEPVVIGEGRHPSWSPDGASIAFTAEDADGFGVYVVDADGSDRRLIGGPSVDPVAFPIWSPDGTHISYFDSVANAAGSLQEQDLYVSDLVESWQVGPMDVQFGFFPFWTDEGVVVYSNLGRTCWLPSPYREPNCQALGRSPLASPSGARVAFLESDGRLCLTEPNSCPVAADRRAYPAAWQER